MSEDNVKPPLVTSDVYPMGFFYESTDALPQHLAFLQGLLERFDMTNHQCALKLRIWVPPVDAADG